MITGIVRIVRNRQTNLLIFGAEFVDNSLISDSDGDGDGGDGVGGGEGGSEAIGCSSESNP